MGTVLNSYLKQRGIKQTWLADKVGITYNTLNLIVNGKSEPTLKTARKISKVLGVSIEELWPEDQENQPE